MLPIRMLENSWRLSSYIGNDVTIGHKVMLYGCTIKDRTRGYGALNVLDGKVVAEQDAWLVQEVWSQFNKVLESGYLYVGSSS